MATTVPFSKGQADAARTAAYAADGLRTADQPRVSPREVQNFTGIFSLLQFSSFNLHKMRTTHQDVKQSEVLPAKSQYNIHIMNLSNRLNIYLWGES